MLLRFNSCSPAFLKMIKEIYQEAYQQHYGQSFYSFPPTNKAVFFFLWSIAFFKPYPTPAAINKTTPSSTGTCASGSSPGSPSWAYPETGTALKITKKIVANNMEPLKYFIDTMFYMTLMGLGKFRLVFFN